jgi:hypothetical protein
MACSATIYFEDGAGLRKCAFITTADMENWRPLNDKNGVISSMDLEPGKRRGRVYRQERPLKVSFLAF